MARASGSPCQRAKAHFPQKSASKPVGPYTKDVFNWARKAQAPAPEAESVGKVLQRLMDKVPPQKQMKVYLMLWLVIDTYIRAHKLEEQRAEEMARWQRGGCDSNVCDLGAEAEFAALDSIDTIQQVAGGPCSFDVGEVSPSKPQPVCIEVMAYEPELECSFVINNHDIAANSTDVSYIGSTLLPILYCAATCTLFAAAIVDVVFTAVVTSELAAVAFNSCRRLSSSVSVVVKDLITPRNSLDAAI